MTTFFFSPDVAMASAPAVHAATDTHIRHEATVPRKDAELLNVSDLVNTQWKANPFFVLLWITQPDFEDFKNKFAAELAERNTAGGERPPGVARP